ncbi:hypothetical protein HELRODRAFT_194105 [Helobdella robusta]|uniref:Uncharacterized protein n=1 Tax=Helobdella robusta TaxID=6412 RepID=T1FVP2_HELRO|nr:hypothetical protein HELRODRAFT_194105 [Helobdella robusta]ESN93463.1 hypothetical protein HELRODRAFT_194105 [Helobdella robusta]
MVTAFILSHVVTQCNIDTGCNFSEKVESSTMIRFIRLTYVRPSNDDSSDISAFYSPPPSVSYKTFLPAPTKVGMCRGSPIYENLGSTCDRAKMWLRCIERRIIGVETFYHPLNCIWHKQDGCERTVLRGEWTTSGRSNRQHKRRRKLVHVVRVFLDGDYTEPPSYLLPPSPMVEEINDCSCNIS